MELDVLIATKIRGFFNQLINEERINSNFVLNQRIYEISSSKNELFSKIIRLKLFDHLGLIQVIKKKNVTEERLLSFNRFLKTDKPYYIYVENPTALFHYSINRSKTFLGKRKIQRLLHAPELKGLIFMSEACRTTFEEVCGEIPLDVRNETIYPLVRKNKHVNLLQLKQKNRKDNRLKLLFIVQGKRFVSKGGLEVIEAFKEMSQFADLTIISSKNDIAMDIFSEINNTPGINFHEFNYSYEELEKIYSEHHIFLQPTSDDSFGLTVLEAMKAGLPIISTTLYAIPEMVIDNENGYLLKPKYRFFDENNFPNKKIWDNRDKTILNSKNIDLKMVQEIGEKVHYLYKHPDILLKLSLGSYNKSNKTPFSDEYIVEQWNNFID